MAELRDNTSSIHHQFLINATLFRANFATYNFNTRSCFSAVVSLTDKMGADSIIASLLLLPLKVLAMPGNAAVTGWRLVHFGKTR